MRLLYVVHQFFPDCHSGTEQYCLAMAREARRRGEDVTILSLHWDYRRESPSIELFEQPYDGFRVLRINHWIGVNPNPVLRDYENKHLEGWFRGVLEDVQPHAVHFFHLRQLGSNLIPLAKIHGCRSVVSLMDFWFLCPRFTLLKTDGSLCEGPPEAGAGCVSCEHPDLAQREPQKGAPALKDEPEARLRALLDRLPRNLKNLGSADHVVAPSRFLAGMFARNGFPSERITVVPYGLEPGRIQRLPTERPRQPVRIAFCGVLSPWKSPHLLVKAIRESALEVQLTVHGRTQEGTFQSYIDSILEKSADDPRIRFPGAYDASSASEVFAAMDLLVVPSTWYENTPFVVLEAFAAGVPVLASDLGGLKEIVTEGRNGALFRAGDAADLREKLTSIVNDPSWFDRNRPPSPASVSDTYEEFARRYSR